jgi:hypothetical protein
MMPSSEFDPNLTLLPALRKAIGSDRIDFGPPIEIDEDGVPYIDDWFIKGLDYAVTDLVCWINSDIVLPRGWFPRVEYLHSYFHRQDRQMAVISRRCDFEFSDDDASKVYGRYGTGKEWPPDFDRIAEGRVLHSTWGIDFFLISKEPMQINFDDIPSFHMGRYRWDPWITGWLRNHMPLITLGDDFCTYHMNHIPKDRQMDDIKVKENFEAARRNGGYKVPNGLASFHLRGRELFEKHEASPLDRIPKTIPEPNSPPEESMATGEDE